MPYAPGIEYHGDQYIAHGIGSFGRNIGEGISEWKKKHDELAQALGESDTIVSRALKTGTMTPDKYTEYLGASAKQKEGIAAGIAKNQALDMADREFAEQKAYHQASLNNAMAIARLHYANSGAGGLTPDMLKAMQDAAEKGNKILAPTSAHSFQYLDKPGQGGDTHAPGSTYRDPSNGQVLGIWESGDKLKLLHDPDAKQAIWDKLGNTDTTNNDGKKDKGPPQSEGMFWDFGHYGFPMQPPGGFKPAPAATPAQGTKPALSAEDQQALEWAQANPNDPRAQAWLKSKGY